MTTPTPAAASDPAHGAAACARRHLRHTLLALGLDFGLFLTALLEFARVESERPVYVGLGTTMLAPVAFLEPLVAGVIVDGWGSLPRSRQRSQPAPSESPSCWGA